MIGLLSAHFAARSIFDEPFRRLLDESVLILGWVANWRPLEIFPYDWRPLVRRRDLYRRLSKASVETLPYPVERSGGPAVSTQARKIAVG